MIHAEGAAAETYVDCDNRGMFHNAGEFARLYPGEAPECWQFCAPRVEAGDWLQAVRAGLATRLAKLGWATTSDPELRLVVDGEVLLPETVCDDSRSFRVLGQAREVRLVSRHAVPCETGLGGDRRRLGFAVRQVTLRSRGLAITVGFDQPSLCEGFHEAEATHRWTNGDARLPSRVLQCFEDEFTVEIAGTQLPAYPILAATRVLSTEHMRRHADRVVVQHAGRAGASG